MRLYKLTDENMKTYAGCQWKLGETKETSGEGELCGPGFLHAYTDPLLAVFLNPIHVNFKNPRLFVAEGKVAKVDPQKVVKVYHALKVGCTKLTLVKELSIPKVTLEQRVKFAVLCAKEVCKGSVWNKWADEWLNGIDRTTKEARRVRAEVWWAGAAAAGAAAAAAGAAEAAAGAAGAAEGFATGAAEGFAAEAVRRASEAAATEAVEIDLPAIAHKAMEE